MDDSDIEILEESQSDIEVVFDSRDDAEAEEEEADGFFDFCDEEAAEIEVSVMRERRLVKEDVVESSADAMFDLYIEDQAGCYFTVSVRADMRIYILKSKIRDITDVPVKEQFLFYEGMELDDTDYELGFYGIEKRDNYYYRMKLATYYTGLIQTYFLDENHFEPKWNTDFREILGEVKYHFRGGKHYRRPLGCMRFGIKVLGKYEDDKWLGLKGLSTAEEWPVAYHGTKELNVLDILRDGFRLDKGVRFAYGKGIYCTNNPNIALQYAHNYEFNGKTYKLIIQCRVDPAHLQILNDRGAVDFWLVPDGRYIRPYAICAFDDAAARRIYAGAGYSLSAVGRFQLPPMGGVAGSVVSLNDCTRPPPVSQRRPPKAPPDSFAAAMAASGNVVTNF